MYAKYENEHKPILECTKDLSFSTAFPFCEQAPGKLWPVQSVLLPLDNTLQIYCGGRFHRSNNGLNNFAKMHSLAVYRLILLMIGIFLN